MMQRGCGMLVNHKWPARRVYVCNFFLSQLLTSYVGRSRRLLPATCNLARCDLVAIWSSFYLYFRTRGFPSASTSTPSPRFPPHLCLERRHPVGGRSVQLQVRP